LLSENELGDLEQFAYSASHDLQEPLRTVSIFTQLLQEQYASQLDAEARGYIDQAVGASKRMERLISGLRVYLQLSVSDDNAAPVDPGRVIARVLETMEAAIAASKADITVAPLPPLWMHELHAEQLFQNLIGNAIKYRATDVPKIHIATRSDDSGLTFFVEDNGIGVEPRYADQIFQIFKRLHTSTEYEGTGIGLAICQKTVQKYGGMIWVETVPARGSRFCFQIPDRGSPANEPTLIGQRTA